MKQTIKKLGKVMAFLMMLMCSQELMAYSCSQDDIDYNINIGLASSNIVFTDARVKARCVQYWDRNNDGELSEAEASSVTSLNYVFYNDSTITSFDELRFFTELKDINTYEFSNCKRLTSVVVPNSVTTIGESAFDGCIVLSGVTIGNSVNTIGGYAFRDCCSLKSVEIPNSVTSIEYGAFYGCSELNNINLPNSIITIGTYAFRGCSGLTSINISEAMTEIGYGVFSECCGLSRVTIPNSITLIDEFAFNSCSSLTCVSLPASIDSIGRCAFYGCDALSEVYSYIEDPSTIAMGSSVFQSNPTYYANRYLYVPNGSLNSYISLTNWKSYFGHIVEIGGSSSPVIDFADARVKAICVQNWDLNGDGELNENEAASVTGLGNCFREDSLITSFNELKYFIGLNAIGSSDFDGCKKLSNIIIPNSITKINSYAFRNCISLTNICIPNSVTTLNYGVFYGCSGLTSVTIPSSVIEMGERAFYECTGLTRVNISDIETWHNISFGSLSNPLMYAHHLYLNGTEVTHLTIPNSVTTISNAFAYCTGITSVSIPNTVTTIGNGAFAGCTGLTEIEIPSSVTSIGSEAFFNVGLTSITIPESITSIGYWAFRSSANLINVYSLITDPSLISMGLGVFYQYPANYSNRTLHVPIGSIPSYRASSEWNPYFGSIVEIGGNTVIANSISLNKSSAVISNGETLQLIATVLPNNTTNKSVLWTSSNNSVATVNSNGLVTAKAVGTTTITAQTTDGSNLSASCSITVTNNTNISFEDPKVKAICVQNWDTNGDGELCEEEAATVTSLNNVFENNSDITSFDELEYFIGLSSIYKNEFRGCTRLTSVSIPRSITSIGDYAFYGCTSLINLNFNAISCEDLNLNSSNPSNLPFANTFIATIQVGEDVQKIPANFARGLTTLRKVTIGNHVTSIGSCAFYGCNCLTDVLFGNSIYIINNYAFYGCTGLKSVYLPKLLNTIGSYAFYHCSGLTDITLPNSVRTLRSYAFNGCSGLKSVYCYAEDPPVMESSDCFNCYNTATLYVPYEALNTYKNTYYWNSFYSTYGVDAEGNILATGISLNETNVMINVNGTFKLTATITPNVSTNKTVTWESSDNSVATVDSTGLVTAIADGTAAITATTTDGSNLSASCTVTVNIIPVTSIALNESSMTLDIDDTGQLYATITPSNATYKTIVWRSSNPAIATVSNNGIISPFSTGTVTITATTTDGTNLSASCQVTVVKRIKSITLNESSLTLTLPETTQLVAIITPSDATNQALTWTSSKTSVATVDANGYVTSKASGTTTIKAVTTDGSNMSATCVVTVTKQYVTTVTLNESSLAMHIGDTFQLIANVQPENASNPTLSWSSGNSSVARVDNNGLVTAIASGTTYVRASATDGSYLYANCSIEVIPDYYITLDTLSHTRGSAAQVVDLPVSLVNKNPISGIQFDVALPSGVEFNLVDGEPDVWLDEARGTRSHSITTSLLSTGKYRVLVTSSSSKDLRGNDGELVHMNMLLPQQHDTGNRYINISNIIASEADETRHTLDNKSTVVHFYYIVGDADANSYVDIADHAATASRILGKNPSPFYYDAANVDANNSLDVVDLVGITNIALGIKPITVRQAPIWGGVENRLFCERLKLNADGEQEIAIGMDCSFDFAGFQMDVSLPRGLQLIDSNLGEEASNLGLVTEKMADGRIRILGTSFSDAEVDGICHQLLTLKVRAEREYMPGSEIAFTDILFAERNLTARSFDGSYVDYIEPSCVYELMEDARIYVENGNIIVDTPVAGIMQLIAVDGRLVENEVQIGHNVYEVGVGGIYIIHFNGKTLKVRL